MTPLRPRGTSRRRRGQSTCAGPSKESSTWNVHCQMEPDWKLLGEKPKHPMVKTTIPLKEDPSRKSPFLLNQLEQRSSPYPNPSAPSHAPFTPIIIVGLMQGWKDSSIKGPYHPSTQLLPAKWFWAARLVPCSLALAKHWQHWKLRNRTLL